MTAGHPPASFLADVLPLLPRAGRALDIATGTGWAALALARHGLRVDALDRDLDALARLAATARRERLAVRAACVDLEDTPPFPLPKARYAVVTVFRYLWRPLFPALAAALQAGGWLVYETFTTSQRTAGAGPRRAEYLLAPGELPQLVEGLEVVRYEEGEFTPGTHTARFLGIAPPAPAEKQDRQDEAANRPQDQDHGDAADLE